MLEEDCRWPGVPLYLMGLPAALRVGPTARNFPGARQAASRIARVDHRSQHSVKLNGLPVASSIRVSFGWKGRR